jgi:hypothetical protein
MCCIGYVISLAFGVLVLAKGRLSLTSSRVLVGRPAYYVGGMLIGMFPIVFVLRLIIFGVLNTLMGPTPNPAALALYFAMVCIVAFTASIPTSQSAPSPQPGQPGVPAGNRPVTLQAPLSANHTERVHEPFQPSTKTGLTVRLGIASLVLSLVAEAMLCVVFLMAALLSASQPSGIKDDSAEAILIGCGLLPGLGLDLVAFGLALAALSIVLWLTRRRFAGRQTGSCRKRKLNHKPSAASSCAGEGFLDSARRVEPSAIEQTQGAIHSRHCSAARAAAEEIMGFLLRSDYGAFRMHWRFANSFGVSELLTLCCLRLLLCAADANCFSCHLDRPLTIECKQDKNHAV